MADQSVYALLALALCSTPSQAMPLSHFPPNHPASWVQNGESVFPSRIVDGTDATEGEYKFYCAYERSSDSFAFCGASLINRMWALSAAHCTGGVNQVRVSAYAFNKFNPKTEEIRQLTQQINHPKYIPSEFPYDYAMLGWQQPIDTVKPLELFDADTFAKDPSPLTAIGLGSTSNTGTTVRPAVLQQVVIGLFTDEECRKFYSTKFQASTMLCAAAPGKGACSGDSGGPLFFTAAGVEKQIGIASWTRIPCTANGYPTVWAKLNKEALGWFEMVMDERMTLQLLKSVE